VVGYDAGSDSLTFVKEAEGAMVPVLLEKYKAEAEKRTAQPGQSGKLDLIDDAPGALYGYPQKTQPKQADPEKGKCKCEDKDKDCGCDGV